MRQLMLALAMAALAAAQNPSQQPPPPPPPPGGQTQAAQPQASQEPNYTFKSDVNLVTFTATVTDGQGRYVRGLRPEYVGVWEDGRRQQISLFRAEVEPVSMGIVFDTSGSMEGKIDDVADAVADCVNTTQPEDEIFLLRFTSKTELMMDFTGNRAALSQAAYNLRAGGSTVLYDAVSQALAKV